MTPIEHFVIESNRIEGINRIPTPEEIVAHADLLSLTRIEVRDLCDFVSKIAPGHVLRDLTGLNVRVGGHIPPRGGPEVRHYLGSLLNDIHSGAVSRHEAHHRYETLHPFTDGNGRSGRALWLWMRPQGAPLGFLHHWYYESLQAYDSRA